MGIALLLALLVGAATIPTTNAGILKVERFGNPHARPIVFVPALAFGPWEWDRQVSALSSRYQIFVVTLPGFDGRTMVSGDDLMERAAASIHQLIRSQHLRRAIVVGHSLGGTITLLFAATYPHDASNVVSVDGGYPVAPTQAQRNERIARAIAPYQGITQGQMASALEKNMLAFTITRKADIERVAPLAGRSSPAAVIAWYRAGLSLDLTQQLARIRVPVTVIVPFDSVVDPYRGFKSANGKLAAYQRWIAHAPFGTAIMIDRSRHFVMIDRPRAFETALEGALMR